MGSNDNITSLFVLNCSVTVYTLWENPLELIFFRNVPSTACIGVVTSLVIAVPPWDWVTFLYFSEIFKSFVSSVGKVSVTVITAFVAAVVVVTGIIVSI